MPILLGISILRLIREGSGCASVGLRNSRRLRDAGVRPGPTAGQPRRNQAEKMPVGSNAQVPANWPFLRILAQSRFVVPVPGRGGVRRALVDAHRTDSTIGPDSEEDLRSGGEILGQRGPRSAQFGARILRALGEAVYVHRARGSR